ncbi:MAG: NDP-sugar synthase [Deltaproteobacteria bacterium]|nr:NDP-sugar synthase [Deltaproteobacteria bacterium]
MRAVIIATGEGAAFAPLNERYPTPLLPLVDRPFIQHVVEYLVDQGVHEFDFVLSHLPEKIEHLLGDGTRWGSTFRFHLVGDASRPYRMLPTILPREGQEPLLLGHADRLPQLALADLQLPPQPRMPVVFSWQNPSGPDAAERVPWTGWAWLPYSCLAQCPDEVEEPELASFLLSQAQAEGTAVEVPQFLSVQSYDALLAAHHTVLTKQFSGLLLTGRETEEGIWLSRNVSLHPTAKLTPPLYIGENCRIGQGVQLGPNAVIGKNCILDARSTARDSIIFSGSYVGEALELADAIVDKNCLVNVRVGAAISVADNFILGSLSEHHLQHWLTGWLARVAGCGLLVLTWPLLLMTACVLKLIRRGPVWHPREVVRLPASSEEVTWQTFRLWSFLPAAATGTPNPPSFADGLRHFFCRFLPALINITKGDLRFVGVTPRTQAELSVLAPDWRALYVRTKAGIVTEAYITFGSAPTEDELYSAETFYSAMAGFRHDAKLLLAYVGRMVHVGAPALTHWPAPTPEESR